MQAFASKALTACQLGSIAAVLGGEQLFGFLGVPTPELYLRYKDRKAAVVMGVWFLGNALQNQLTATGAFEVFYDGHLVRP